MVYLTLNTKKDFNERLIIHKMKQQRHNDLQLIKNAAQILDKLNHKNYPEIATDLVNLVRSYSTGEQFEQTS